MFSLLPLGKEEDFIIYNTSAIWFLIGLASGIVAVISRIIDWAKLYDVEK